MYETQYKNKYGSPLKYAQDTLKFNHKGLSLKIDDFMMAVELTDSNDIDKIKEEITSN